MQTFSSRLACTLRGGEWSSAKQGSLQFSLCLENFVPPKDCSWNFFLKLNWKQHIAYIQNKISKITGILCKTRHYVSLKVLRMLYYALIYPYLHYGNIIWANTYQSSLDPLIKLQKKIIRIILFAGYKDHTPPILKKLSILPFHQINEEKTALFMFRYFNKMLPATFDSFFTLNRDFHNHYTRSSTKIHITYVRIN